MTDLQQLGRLFPALSAAWTQLRNHNIGLVVVTYITGSAYSHYQHLAIDCYRIILEI